MGFLVHPLRVSGCAFVSLFFRRRADAATDSLIRQRKGYWLVPALSSHAR